jgi:hypothetical protein
MVRFVVSGIRSISMSFGFDSEMKRRFMRSLAECPIDKWIRRYACSVFWELAIPTTSYSLTVHSVPTPNLVGPPGLAFGSLDIGMRFHVSPPSQQQAGCLLLDVWFKCPPKQEEKLVWYPLASETFYELLLSGLATITDPSIYDQFAEGFLLWSPLLFAHINAKKMPWLDISGLSCIESLQTNEYFQSPAEFSEAQRIGDLDKIAKDWLSRLLSDSGCIDYETIIQNMRHPDF